MPQSSKQLMVAVVEDDPRIGELIREEVCDEGHLCQGYLTAESFLEEADNLNPDLVLLDLMLPGVDGLECLRRLRELPRLQRCPVVIVTALNDAAKRREAQKLGAFDYILKPDLFDQLPQLLASLAQQSLEQ
jgi:two-component system OmpR family response regulator|tara:strand:+ start:132 stop:527 length:396 start_codon:yes stop_codon:yes gene_type:complete